MGGGEPRVPLQERHTRAQRRPRHGQGAVQQQYEDDCNTPLLYPTIHIKMSWHGNRLLYNV